MTKYLATIIFCLALNALYAQSYKLDTLLYHDDAADRIDFVILGDGYLESQLGEFLDDSRSMTNALFGTFPFKQYKNYFNVFTIFVASNASGAANDPASLIDNYFGSTFNYAGIERLLFPMRTDKIYNLLSVAFPTYDQLLMVVNSSKYGGSGGAVATFSVHPAASEIAIHELGHSFAGLADEYWAGDQYAAEKPNMTRETNPYLIRWSNWLNQFGVGILPYGNGTWYKPHNNCKMEVLGAQFCAVCKEQIIWTIQDAMSPVSSQEATAGTEAISFSMELIEPDPNTFKISWLLNGQEFDKNVATTEVSLQDLNNGANTVLAIIWDSTAFDRRNAIHVTSVKWMVETSILVHIQETIEDRPGLVVTGVKDEISGMRLRVFPNPSSNRLIVEYDLPAPAQTELSILDSEGRRVFGVVMEGAAQRNTQEIDVSGYSNGLYILEFKSGSIRQSLRILKTD